MPMFSVITPTYNCGAFVEQAIDSVLAQTFEDYEIIVLDDGSTDNTREILQRYSSQPKVRYLYQENRGLAAARNAAIRASNGRYLALLDADDLWTPEKLAVQARYLEQHPNVALLCSNSYLFYENDLQNTSKLLQSLPERTLGARELFTMIMTRENPVVCPTTVIARWAIDRIGAYDEELSRLGAEDRDMSLRLTSAFEALCTPECLAYYRVRRNSMQRNVEKMFQARMHVLRKFVRNNPELMKSQRLAGTAFSTIYLWSATSYLEARKFSRANMNMLKAIWHQPLHAARAAPAFFRKGIGRLLRRDH
jgi:glycosyltransferase involved in cell wall biosynthesis